MAGAGSAWYTSMFRGGGLFGHSHRRLQAFRKAFPPLAAGVPEGIPAAGRGRSWGRESGEMIKDHSTRREVQSPT